MCMYLYPTIDRWMGAWRCLLDFINLLLAFTLVVLTFPHHLINWLDAFLNVKEITMLNLESPLILDVFLSWIPLVVSMVLSIHLSKLRPQKWFDWSSLSSKNQSRRCHGRWRWSCAWWLTKLFYHAVSYVFLLYLKKSCNIYVYLICGSKSRSKLHKKIRFKCNVCV